ncbi:ribosome rescue protein RqcH [Caldivirga sp. UBA161]|uniref:ribosome rescue protein RqcH n=1 Tax=Caldivirga sp. UBA161 TaxID=1915569 RepID=UPI0025C1CD88|nr:ribosome rescue protein RqcH [Caldivirga sp. UBA161]
MPIKKALNALDLVAIATELNAALGGGRVIRVYRLGDSHYFKVRASDIAYLIANPRRISQTWRIPQNLSPSPLRKFIEDCVINRFEANLDRVMSIDLNCGRLIIELIPPFNMVFTVDGKVKWLLHEYRGKDREIKIGSTYSEPPRRFLDPRFFDNLLKLSEKVGLSDEALAKGLGLGIDWAREVCTRSGCSDLTLIWGSIRGILEALHLGRLKPVIYASPSYVSPIPFHSIKGEFRRVESFNRAVDDYFTSIEVEKVAEEKVKGIEDEIARLESSIKELEDTVSRYLRDAEDLRRRGELIMSRLYEFSELHEALLRTYIIDKDSFKAKVKGIEYGSIKVIDYDPLRKAVKVMVNNSEVELTLGESPGETATKYFEEAKRLEKKAKAAEVKLMELRGKVSELRSRVNETTEEARATVRFVASREWFERFRWFITSGGSPVLAGKDAGQNEALVKRHMNPWDLFLHADVQGGPVTVIKVIRGQEVKQQDLIEAAQYAAAYSKAWKLGANSLDVYYVKGEQVSKKAPSGEYLSKGGFMIYGQRGWIRGVELIISVGLRIDGDVIRLVSAPPTAIGSLANYYVTLKPGNGERSEVAGRIKELLIKKHPEARQIPVEHVIEHVPGPSLIIESNEGNPITWDTVKGIFSKVAG